MDGQLPAETPSRIDQSEARRTGRSPTSVSLDQRWRAVATRATGGVSPAALASTWAEWWLHAAFAPASSIDLATELARAAVTLGQYSAGSISAPGAVRPVAPAPEGDHRFESQSWSRWPYNLAAQSFLAAEAWWDRAISDTPGFDRARAAKLRFWTRQALDALCPANVFALNPEAIDATIKENGDNLKRGLQHWADDLAAASGAGTPLANTGFELGTDLAATPGRVIYRNALIELIQYAPTTDAVKAEPVLIVPAWIMKYYILDLSAQNSLVRWLVAQGYSVFMISWRNPDGEDRDLGFDDYRRLGVMSAVEAALEASGADRLHAAGYCLGGTLLSVAASAMARDGDDRLASLSLLAAQIDFTLAGELQLFIGESEMAALESLMDERGVLDSRQMAGAFQMLRSNDLIWSRIVRDYYLGLPRPHLDLLAWNADTTRMPAAMHSEYLRGFYLDNAFANGRWTVDGRPVSFGDVRAPIFAVGAEKDHVAPWRSVFAVHRLADSEVTFALANGGHNGAIISEPGRPGRRHRLSVHADLDRFEDPDSWLASTPAMEGSWWESWVGWLDARSSPEPQPAREPRRAAAPVDNQLDPSAPLPEAPGTYVFS